MKKKEPCSICRQQSCSNCKSIADCAKYDKSWHPQVHGWQCQSFSRNNYCCHCGRALGKKTVEEEQSINLEKIKKEVSKWPDWKRRAAQG